MGVTMSKRNKKSNAAKPIVPPIVEDTKGADGIMANSPADTIYGEQGEDAVADTEAMVVEEPIVEEPIVEYAEVITSVEPTPLYMLYAKQVKQYNGHDLLQAWQIFCFNFAGMGRYVNHSPSMTLLTTEQLALLKSVVSV